MGADPQPLPESLVGKPLYPCITYKNVALEVNWGPVPLKSLPFTCRMLKDAAAADLEIPKAAAERKNEVLFPVGLPDQGVFDWLDGYLETNPLHVELSDRKVLDWARMSSVYRQRGSTARNSNGKPGMKFGIPLMDDMSVQKTLLAVAPALKRDFVRMELKSNLISAERKEALRSFPPSSFKRVAVVAMGEPPDALKTKAQDMLLAVKTEEAQKEKARKDREKERKRWAKEEEEARAKRAKVEEEKKEAADKQEEGEESKKDAEAEAEPAPDKEEKKGTEEKKDGDADMKAEEDSKPEEAKKDEVVEDEEEKPVELTEDEKKIWFPRYDTPDLSRQVLAKSFANFS